MKKTLVLAILIFITGINCTLLAQKGVKQYLDKDKKTTANGDEVAFYRLVKYTESGKPIGAVQDFYLTDTLQFAGSLSAENPDAYEGTCVWYYPNGAKHREAYYLNGELAGRVAVWNPDGRALYEGAYKNGKQWGRHIFWDEKGNFVSVDFYQNGEKFNISEVANALPALPDDTKATLYALSKHLSIRFLTDAADAYAFNQFGEQLLEQKQFNQALCLFMASKQIREVLALPAAVQQTHQNMAYAYEGLGNTKMAQAYLQKSGALSVAKPQPEKPVTKQPAKDRQEALLAYEASIRQTSDMLNEQPKLVEVSMKPDIITQQPAPQPVATTAERTKTLPIANLPQKQLPAGLGAWASASAMLPKAAMPVVFTQTAMALQTADLANQDNSDEVIPDEQPKAVMATAPDDVASKTTVQPINKAKPDATPNQPPTTQTVATQPIAAITTPIASNAPIQAVAKPTESDNPVTTKPVLTQTERPSGLATAKTNAPETEKQTSGLPTPKSEASESTLQSSGLVAAKTSSTQTAAELSAMPDVKPPKQTPQLQKPSAAAAALPNAEAFISGLSAYIASKDKLAFVQALSAQLGVNINTLNRQDAAAINQLVTQLLNSGAYTGITAAFEAQPDALKIIKDPAAKAALLMGVAKAAQQQGVYGQALQGFEQVAKISASTKDQQATWIPEATMAIAQTYAAQHDYDRAVAALQETYTAAQKSGNDALLAKLNNQLGNLQFAKGAYDKAAAHYKLSAEHHEYLANRSGVALATLKTANMLALQGKYAEAETQYRQAMTLAERLKLPKHLAAVYNNWGVLLYFKGNYAEAHRQFTQSAQLWEKENEGIATQLPALLNSAAATAENGNPQQAYQLYRRYLTMAQPFTSLSLNNDWQQLTVKKTDNAAMEAVKLAVQLSKPDEAFALAQQYKMQQTATILAQPENGLPNSIDPTLQAEELYWLHSLQAVQEQFTHTVNAVQTKQLAQTEQMLLSGFNNFVQELYTKAPDYAALKYPKLTDVEQVQQTLNPDEVMISYAMSAKQTYAFVIAKEVYQCFALDNSAVIEAEVEQLYANYLKPASELPEKDLRKAEKKLQDAFALHAGKLYSKLFLPLQKSGLLAGAKKLIIVPDGILYTLPFNLLAEAANNANYSDYNYLAKQYILTVYPTAQAFCQPNKQATTANGKLLAVANASLQPTDGQNATYFDLTLGKTAYKTPDIPAYDAKPQFAPFEAAKLTLLQQNQAANAKLQQLSGQAYQYLHLGAPFAFNGNYPQLSGLVVGGANGNNALFTLSKMAQLSPNATLLNMPFAYCATPGGLTGKEVMALQYTALHSGIGAATYSLWLPQVQQANQFYTLFYQHLAQGLPTATAYQQTQLQMMQSAEFAAPAAWAAFTLCGGMVNTAE